MLANQQQPPPRDNFTNILRAAFYLKVMCVAFLYLHFRFVVFWHKRMCAKAAQKMLVKLIPGVNILRFVLFLKRDC